jgi:hypothetical protein
MHSLPETQALTLDALLHGSAERAHAASALLRPTRGAPGNRRLQVYRNNLQTSLSAALEAVFPVVAKLVGAAFFGQTARAFIAAHPSRSGNLHDFGRELPAFLRASASLRSLPYLGDVAALEWACHEVYHEADAEPLEPARLADVPAPLQPTLRLQLQPATRFVASLYPVLAIWQANQDGAAPATIALDDGGVELLVARRDFDIEFRLLAEAEACWLRALAAGRSLAEALQAAFERDPAFEFGATLVRHLQLGTFESFSTDCAASPIDATGSASASASAHASCDTEPNR